MQAGLKDDAAEADHADDAEHFLGIGLVFAEVQSLSPVLLFQRMVLAQLDRVP